MTANYRQIRGLLGAREEFTGNSMEAFTGDRLGQWTTGRLGHDERQRFIADGIRTKIIYLVVSYSTPIAWVMDDGDVYVTAQKFSTTTSRHQNLCRAWL